MDGKLRDLIIHGALGYILVDDWGVSSNALLTEDQRAKMDALGAELLPDSDEETQALIQELYEEYANKLALSEPREDA
ncbi:hypothetical protein [Paenibacillus illinoisensis]|uniref:hypothetical protein n=1 Tax=Paenibacillus illinoisensis TaxID=59845 RepID=UPI002040A02E|nr:hypothetical protein [Paenibacillus illinoisensis]MCM3205658.1 hypothetical protein [Paenibacillus illinoisensis]